MDGMARQGRGDTTMRRTQQSRQEFLRDAADILQREWGEHHLLKSCPVFFNITNFHLYNATHGFRQGDLCLQHIEGILQDVFPERPVIHLGADNFAVLAEEANVQARIDKACQRVQAYIGNPNIALKAGIRFLSGPRSLKDLKCRVRQRSQDCLRHHQEGCLALLGYLHAGARPAPQDAELRA